MKNCSLCEKIGETLIWHNDLCRVILVNEPDYPGFCRVITQAHIKEITDLSEDLQWQLMRIVFSVEKSIREILKPEKMNLASLGNVVPHLHWHIIPRFINDTHFPNPIWGERTNTATTVKRFDREAFIAKLGEALEKQGLLC